MNNPISALISALGGKDKSIASKQDIDLIVPAMVFAERRVKDLDAGILERTFLLAWNSKKTFAELDGERVDQMIKGVRGDAIKRKPSLEMGFSDFEDLASAIYVMDATWCELFAQEIPTLSPKHAQRSKLIAKKFLCILYLEEWYRGHLMGGPSARMNALKNALFS